MSRNRIMYQDLALELQNINQTLSRPQAGYLMRWSSNKLLNWSSVCFSEPSHRDHPLKQHQSRDLDDLSEKIMKDASKISRNWWFWTLSDPNIWLTEDCNWSRVGQKVEEALRNKKNNFWIHQDECGCKSVIVWLDNALFVRKTICCKVWPTHGSEHPSTISFFTFTTTIDCFKE